MSRYRNQIHQELLEVYAERNKADTERLIENVHGLKMSTENPAKLTESLVELMGTFSRIQTESILEAVSVVLNNHLPDTKN